MASRRYKFEAGTPAIVQAIGLGAAIDYVNSVGKARIRAHESGAGQIRARAAWPDQFAANHRQCGQTRADRLISRLKGAHPHDVATIIDRAGVAVRAGTHCVMPLLARYGLTATCRASFAMYNTKEEVDTLCRLAREGAGIFCMTEDTQTHHVDGKAAGECCSGRLAGAAAG